MKFKFFLKLYFQKGEGACHDCSSTTRHSRICKYIQIHAFIEPTVKLMKEIICTRQHLVDPEFFDCTYND